MNDQEKADWLDQSFVDSRVLTHSCIELLSEIMDPKTTSDRKAEIYVEASGQLKQLSGILLTSHRAMFSQPTEPKDMIGKAKEMARDIGKQLRHPLS